MEITSELKNANLKEGVKNQRLLSRIMFSFRKIKFWIVLYGIAIASPIIDRTLNADKFLGLFLGTFKFVYTFGIVPIATLLALGFKLLPWILGFIPRFKDFKSPKQLDHKWLLVVSSVITGVVISITGGIMILYDFFTGPQEMGGLGGLFILILGGFWMILSLVFAGAIIAIKKIVRLNLKQKLRIRPS